MKLKEQSAQNPEDWESVNSDANQVILKNSVLGLPTISGLVFVNIIDIVRCESVELNTTFHLADKRKMVVSRVLKECEDRLQDIGFYRVHESQLVNVIHIDQYLKEEGGKLILSDGSLVKMPGRKKDDFLYFMNKFLCVLPILSKNRRFPFKTSRILIHA